MMNSELRLQPENTSSCIGFRERNCAVRPGEDATLPKDPVMKVALDYRTNKKGVSINDQSGALRTVLEGNERRLGFTSSARATLSGHHYTRY
jgi:hypothetical protein